MKNSRLLWIGGLAAGAVGLIGVGIYMSNKSAAASTGGTTATGGTTTTGGTTPPAGSLPSNAGTYAVILNGDGTTVPAAPAPAAGQTVQFYLPTGASWGDNTAANNSGATSGLSSISIPNSGYNNATAIYSGTQATSNIAITWVDTGGTSHTTNIALT
jgi:hypothetical protein